MLFKSRILLITTILVFTLMTSATAQEMGTGLELESPELFVFAEVQEEESSITLSEDTIRSRVELALRQNGIDILTREGFEFNSLGISVNIIGYAFNTQVTLRRPIMYEAGGKQYAYVTDTWRRSYTGTHGGNSEYILNGIDRLVDTFIAELFRENDF